MMCPKSAEELDAKWKRCPWYHKPSGSQEELPHPRDNLNLRLRRALSWLGRAEKEYKARDFDAAFIFYWVAFNAMYGRLGTSSVDEAYEKDRRRDYFDGIVAFADAESVLYDAIWSVLRDEVESMLANRYVYEPYWKHRKTRQKIKTGNGGSTGLESERRRRYGELERKTCSANCSSA